MASSLPRVILLRLPPPGPTGPAPVTVPSLAPGLLAGALLHREVPCRPILPPPRMEQLAGDTRLLDWILRQEPRAVCFSLTVWNVRRSLHLAGRIRRSLPGCLLVGGGPEVTSETASPPGGSGPLAETHLDHWVLGEGEAALPALLDRHLAMPGSAEARGLVNAPIPDLAEPILPYGQGLIHPGSAGDALLETARGCDLRCAYCFYHQLRPGIRVRPPELVSRELAYLQRAGARRVYLTDPSFLARRDAPELLQGIAAATGGALRLHTELRAEAVTPEAADRLHRAGFRSVECGLQTTNPRAMAGLGRTIRPEAYVRGAHLLMARGIRVTTGIILGLPGDDPEGFTGTCSFVREHGLDQGLQVFPLLLLPGTRYRRDAAELGIRFDPVPPYRVIAAEGWTPEGLRAAEVDCEELLGVDLEATRLPVLRRPPPGGYRAASWDVETLHLAPGARLTRRAIRRFLQEARRHVTLRIRWEGGESDPWEAAGLALEMLGADEPHGSLDVVVEGPDLPDPDRLSRLLTSRRPAEDHYLHEPGGGDASLRVVLLALGGVLARHGRPPEGAETLLTGAMANPTAPGAVETAAAIPWVDVLAVEPPPETGWDAAARERLRGAARIGLPTLVRRPAVTSSP